MKASKGFGYPVFILWVENINLFWCCLSTMNFHSYTIFYTMRRFGEIWCGGRTDGHLTIMLLSRIETGVSLHMSEVLCVTRNEWIFTSSAESVHEFNTTGGCSQCFDLHWLQTTAFPSRTPRDLISKSSKLEHWDHGFELNSSQRSVSAYFLSSY